MRTPTSLRHRLIAAAVFTAVLASTPMPAHAASKEIIELQTQVQQLLDMVQRIQSTLDSRFGVMQNLAQQTADSASQMTAAVTALQQKLALQTDTTGGKLDTVSTQVQSLNDSIDELKSRMTKLNKSIEDLQGQLQNTPGAALPASSSSSSASGSGAAASSASAAPAENAASSASGAGQAPPLQATFQAAVRDFNAAKYDVAAGEFQDVIHYYPLDEMAGQSHFYLGEIAYHQQNYADAIKSYNAVLEGFSGCSKAPAAQLHKGLSLLLTDKKDAGIRELRLLIQRRPQTPEAAQARTKLNALGVKLTAR
jgi:TolA-binding protein